MQLADLKFKDGSKFTSLLDLVFPIGSTYMSMGSASPDTLFGGTWSKVTGGVLALAGTSGYAAAGAAGGSKKISVSQMPSHTHTIASSGNYAVDSPLALYYTTTTEGNNWRMWSSNTQASQGVVYNKSTGGGGLLSAPRLGQSMEAHRVAFSEARNG